MFDYSRQRIVSRENIFNILLFPWKQWLEVQYVRNNYIYEYFPKSQENTNLEQPEVESAKMCNNWRW